MANSRWPEIERIYHLAREQAPSGRAAWLEQTCGVDTDLRQEVESLLRHAEGVDGYLDAAVSEVKAQARKLPDVSSSATAPIGPGEAGETVETVVTAPLVAGRQLGPYEILSPIGSGGMGEVWKARDTRLDRTVAIKRIKGAHLGRFRQEARAIAALNHPHICQIHDVGEDFLVLEYIEGRPLTGPLRLDEVLKLALQIASALEEAHGRGILHCDLKPANIMVTPKGSVKLLDFGLAKLQNGDDSSGEKVVAGTASYMSPEQAKGEPLDRRSDIFSFGAVLYELVSGRRPFSGRSLASVIGAVIRDEAPPLDSPIANVVMKCLAKAPGQRYQSVEELREALKQVSPKPQQQPSIAVLPFANMSSDADQNYFSDGLAEEIINLLAQIPGLKVIARTSAFAFRGKDQDIRTIAQALGVNTLLEGSVRRSGNWIRVTAQLISAEDGSHLFSRRYDREMSDVFAMQDEIASTIAKALRMELWKEPATRRRYTPSLPAYEAVLKARHCMYNLTPDSVAQGREFLAQAIALDPAYAVPYSELSLHFASLTVMGVTPAHQGMPMAKDAARRALVMDPSQPAEALALLGLIATVYEYDWEEAGRLFGPSVVDAHLSSPMRVCFGYYLVAVGRIDEAIEQVEFALTEDPLNPFLRLHLAIWLGTAGRPAESAAECNRILEIRKDYGLAWLTLSIASLRQGEIEKAMEAAETAVRVIPWSKGSQGCLAALLSLTGHAGKAAELLRQFADRNAYGTPLGLTSYFLIRGDIDEAAEWAARTIEQRAPMIFNLLRGPLAAELRRSPRWLELKKMMNLPATD